MTEKQSPERAAEESTSADKQIHKEDNNNSSSAQVFRGSVLITNLPADMKEIYTHTLRRLAGPVVQGELGAVQVMEEVDGATLTVEVKSKAAAQQLYRRLQNTKVYGRRWKVQFMPRRAIECGTEACLVDCRVVPAAPASLVERALSAVPGFLTLIRHAEEEGNEKQANDKEGSKPQKNKSQEEASEVAAPRKKARKEDAKKARHHAEEENDEEEREAEEDESYAAEAMPSATLYDTDCETYYLASFVDEGSALHARAVLSGRLIGNSGVHLFLERRR